MNASSGKVWFSTAALIFYPLICCGATTYFRDVTADLGIDFKHENDFSPERRLVETMGAGGALLDYDQDGDLDLYLAQGNILNNPRSDLQNRLFRNDGHRFIDVTETAKVGNTGYAMGAVSADYNGDGFPDLYITNLGNNILYKNNGDGTFTDATKMASIESHLLSTSAAFGDLDLDGDLDLYVCNYVEYELDKDVPCYFGRMRIYCGPNQYHGISDILYRNNGNGTFTDITKAAGIFEPTTRGLGVVLTDVNSDGLPDIYVANDMTHNTLFINQGDGTFKEEGRIRGCAYNDDGISNGSMGVDSGDYDNDGDLDLWVTNFSEEANCLMVNNGQGYFDDLTFDLGLAEPSFQPLAFGTRFLDYDNNGWSDLVIGNGHIMDNVNLINQLMTYAQSLQLFHNHNGVFEEITNGTGFSPGGYVVRGLMTGDYDNDGDVDLFLCQSNRPLVVLRNEIGNKSSWLTIKLVSGGDNTAGIGSKVSVTTGELTQTREVLNGASYLSGNDMRLSFGLSKAEVIDKIEIRWSNGQFQTLTDVASRQILVVYQKME